MNLNELFDRVKDYRVLVVGDTIRDEYQYVTVLGKASKENLIATRAERLESFYGGVHAAANHVRQFCQNVVIHTGPRVIIKRRFIDEIYMRKLFEVHTEDPMYVPGECPDPNDFDLVIVTDFGHGCVTPGLIGWLTSRARFLAVNAQSNAANYGFNLITKYPRADYVVIDEPEARLAAHDAASPINEVIQGLGFPNIIVTHGVYGSIGYNGTFCHKPAFTQTVIDTIGAGDAFFCITAPLAAAGVSMDTLLHIGNAAGAAKVGIVGHRRSVTIEDLNRVIDASKSSQDGSTSIPLRERGQCSERHSYR